MKHTIEMASCGIIYVPSSMKIGPGVQEIIRNSKVIGEDTQTAR
jgi:hypothetical protein